MDIDPIQPDASNGIATELTTATQSDASDGIAADPLITHDSDDNSDDGVNGVVEPVQNSIEENSDDDDEGIPQLENTDPLPEDFVIIPPHRELTQEEERHTVAFYQGVLTLLATKAESGGMMMKEKYLQIEDACLCLHNGETMSHLQKHHQANSQMGKEICHCCCRRFVGTC